MGGSALASGRVGVPGPAGAGVGGDVGARAGAACVAWTTRVNCCVEVAVFPALAAARAAGAEVPGSSVTGTVEVAVSIRAKRPCSAGVPARRAVPSPRSVSVTPSGIGPALLTATDG
ncbi:unannotated protein [freshwater metagenome]|uniref:Unannotated protein n=1 Tax=freshwater metagenome TaxID=449393 RepID=A0A6J7LPB2_9ZZZZ|nr:hypothetical protein [Actinomycetota bacterium]